MDATYSAGIAAGDHSAYLLHSTKRRYPGSYKRRLACSGALLLALAGLTASARAEFFPEASLQSSNRGQFWVNLGGMSQHFENASRFNQQNFGFGIEYQVDPRRYLVLGGYHNSVRKETRYVGGAWMPLAVGPVKLGVIAGVADGYPKMRNGGFFPIALPVVSVETKHVGANFVIMPSVADKVSGCVALQLKYRFQ